MDPSPVDPREEAVLNMMDWKGRKEVQSLAAGLKVTWGRAIWSKKGTTLKRRVRLM